MTDVTLRLARPEDEEALSALIDKAYARFRQDIPDLPDVSAGLADDIATNTVFVAVSNDEIAGGAVAVLSDDRATLANLAVDPDHGGKGIGGALIDKVEEHVRQQGHTHLHLATHKDMPQNVSLYEHLGWVVSGQKGSKVLMEKAL